MSLATLNFGFLNTTEGPKGMSLNMFLLVWYKTESKDPSMSIKHLTEHVCAN